MIFLKKIDIHYSITGCTLSGKIENSVLPRKKCKSALGSDGNEYVRQFCRISCGQCGKLLVKIVNLFKDSCRTKQKFNVNQTNVIFNYTFLQIV